MEANSGNGRFDDTRLDALVAAIDNASQRVAYFDNLLRELVEGARTATDERERERYATQALIASATLTASRNTLAIGELEARLEELAQLTRSRIDALTKEVHDHDERARDAIQQGHDDVTALIAREDSK